MFYLNNIFLVASLQYFLKYSWLCPKMYVRHQHLSLFSTCLLLSVSSHPFSCISSVTVSFPCLSSFFQSLTFLQRSFLHSAFFPLLFSYRSFLYARLQRGRVMVWWCPSVRVSVSPFSALFSYMLWLSWNFAHDCFNVIRIKFECRHFVSIFEGVMPLCELRI